MAEKQNGVFIRADGRLFVQADHRTAHRSDEAVTQGKVIVRPGKNDPNRAPNGTLNENDATKRRLSRSRTNLLLG
jgi:hypothetical protein